MSNELAGKTRSKFRVYLIYLTLHALAFLALAMIRAAVHHPVILENPLTLFASLVSMFYVSTLVSNQLHSAYHNLYTSYRVYLDHDKPKTPGHYGLFMLKLLSSVTINTVLLFWTAFVLTYPVVNVVSASIGFLAYHLLTVARDYCSSCYAFDFVDRYFSVTLAPNSTVMKQSWSNEDDSSYPYIAGHAGLRNIDLVNRPDLCCGLHTILPQLYNENPVAMTRPLQLIHKRTGAIIWAESDVAIHHMSQISADYTVRLYDQPDCQAKIHEIRQYYACMSQRMNAFKQAQRHFRSLITSDVFKNYMQAISSTEDVSLPRALKTDTSIPQDLVRDLNNQRNYVLSHFQRGPVTRETTPPTLSVGASAEYCAITGNAVTIPIIVRLTHVDAADAQNNQTFYCDLYSLIHWLDNNPNGYHISDQVAQDKATINQIIYDTPMLDKDTANKLQHVSEKIIDSHPSNPIGLLIAEYGPLAKKPIEALLRTQYMRQRLHAPDLMKSICKGYLSLSDYLQSRRMHDLNEIVTQHAYTRAVSSYRSTRGYTAELSGDDILLHKRWPMGIAVLLSPDFKVTFALDESMLQDKHAHMLQVIQHVLKPQMEAIKSQLVDEQTYYIHSPEQACVSSGNDVSIDSLLEMGLFQETSRITTTPLPKYSNHMGLRLFADAAPAQQSSNVGDEKPPADSNSGPDLRPTTLFREM